jgi:NTP pyrophosphatase (non-canonical NTP hydrolase)
VIKARWEQLRQWLRGWKPVSTREYEALAREFGMITGRCLAAEEALVKSRGTTANLVRKIERDKAAVCGELPGLTPGELERLAILAEECGEVATAVGKILRFGWESQSPYGGKPNRKALEQELGNVRAVVNLMLDAGDLNLNAIQSWQRNKRVALVKWTLYQECSMGREQQLEMIRAIAESASG